MRPPVTEIRIDEHGDETHESWILIGANRISSAPGVRLFDSEIDHQHFIWVEVHRCSRRRQLNHDWIHSTKLLMRVAMSQAQWGAFVSSFGQGDGVPATLEWLDGDVSQAPYESRLGESVKDVREAGDRSLATIVESYEKLEEAFETGGKRAQREALRDLGIRLKNAPANMEFAAKVLVEHTENVVTKARADLEAMARAASDRAQLAEPVGPRQLGEGKP